jgi:lipopolysaccharide transport system ATP-binding protein
MGDIAVQVENLGKRYRIGKRERYRTLRDGIARAFSLPFHQRRDDGESSAGNGSSDSPTFKNNSQPDFIWALKEVSFEVKHGEVVGVIGRNGAGKSTLLKILSRITEPTEGEARIYGRVGSLLEVGTGFHYELTGRENIYLNGAILGMKKAEIDRRFDEIVAFAEVETFLDTPVKHYSSGMYLRLAFSVAAHLEPEILIVDEVLAVGDAGFQKKCLGKMGDVAKEGRTVLFVSHNIAAIRNLCSRCILLESGRISIAGHTDRVIEAYLCNNERHDTEDLALRKDRKGNGIVRFKSVSFRRLDGIPTSTFLSGENCEISLEYNRQQELPDSARILVGIGVYGTYGDCLFLCSNELTNEISGAWPVTGDVTCRIPRLPLAAGLYNVNVYAAVNGEVADWLTDAATFEVQNSDFFGTGRLPPSSHGQFLVPHSWSVDRGSDLRPAREKTN